MTMIATAKRCSETSAQVEAAIVTQLPHKPDWNETLLLALREIPELVQQSLQELPLSDDAKREAAAHVVDLFRENLPHFVSGVVLISSLGRYHDSDTAYFRKRNIPDCDSDNLTQETDLKLLKGLKQKWSTGNIGALRSKTRENVLNDYCRRTASHEKRYDHSRGDLDTFPDKCNPFQSGFDQDDGDLLRNRMWESIDSMPEEQRNIAYALAAGQTWPEIVHDLKLKDRKSEAMRKVQDALGPVESLPRPWSRSKSRRKKLS